MASKQRHLPPQHSKMNDKTSPNPEFRMPKSDVENRMSEQIDKGRNLLERTIRSDAELQEAHQETYKWIDYTKELLRRAFTTRGYSDEFIGQNQPALFWSQISQLSSFSARIEDYRRLVQSHLDRLESIYERFELIPEVTGSAHRISQVSSESQSKTVFVVHGTNEVAKVNVARFLEQIELKPVILHEQASEGLTIIEKIERYSDVGFAVIILTADDEAYPHGKADLKANRARQNVILEFGFFIGKLGRERTAVLYENKVELPTDIHGLVYIPLDTGNGWKLDLAKNMKAAGIEFDMNRVCQ